MKSKFQIDTSRLSSEITQEVLKAIMPLLLLQEEDSKMKSIPMENEQRAAVSALPQFGLLRLWQILGDKRRGSPPIIPVSKSTWWAGVKSGKYPQPVKLSARCTCWRVEDIRELLARMERS